jgi:hypothetical protein
MKIIAAITFLILFVNIGLSQDLIEKRDGEKIEGKIIEITESSIKYKRKDQPNGPIRNIAVADVKLITYEDGSKERFVTVDSPKDEATPIQVENPQVVKRRGPDRIRNDKDRILGPGMFIEMLPGYANYDNGSTFNSNYGGLGIKFGNKWYFGKNEKYRPGIQMTWIRFGAYSTSLSPSDISKGYFSVLNLGFANAIKFKDKMGMEVNANIGPTILQPPIPGDDSGEFGLLYGLEVKYRLGRLALGIDFTRVEEQLGYGYGIGKGDAITTLSLSVGFKF